MLHFLELCQQFGSKLCEYHASKLEQTGNMSDSIGKKLKALRSPRMSQDEMAALSGIPRTTIQRIERGESHDMRDIEAICKVLKMSPAELWDSPRGASIPRLSDRIIEDGPTVRDAALILLRLGEVSPERRAVALAFLMDDPSLVPDDAEHAPFLDLLKSR